MEPSTPSNDPQDLLVSRLGEYQQIWEDATAKMMVGTYRSEDLVEDWFRWWGHAARDMTAAATLAFSTATLESNRTGGPESDPHPGPDPDDRDGLGKDDRGVGNGEGGGGNGE